MNTPIVIRRTCDTASCCHQSRGSCCCKVHREDSLPAGGPIASHTEDDGSWLYRNPWIWFWVAFLVLISVWTIFFMLASKNQPQVIPLPATIRG